MKSAMPGRYKCDYCDMQESLHSRIRPRSYLIFNSFEYQICSKCAKIKDQIIKKWEFENQMRELGNPSYALA